MATLTWTDEQERIRVVNEFEALRQNGTNNMMDFYAVQQEAHERGLTFFVRYFANDSNKYSKFLFSFDGYEEFIDQDLVDELVEQLY